MTIEVLPDIVEECLDEAEFLWMRWEAELDTHARNLDGVYDWTEERLQGALDGVRCAGDAALPAFVAPWLDDERTSRVTVAAHLFGSSASPELWQSLAKKMAEATGPKLAAMRRGLEVLGASAPSLPVVEAALVAASPEHKATAVALRSFQRRHPGAELGDLIVDANPVVRAIGWRACRRMPDVTRWAVEQAVAENDPGACIAATETGIIFGIAASWARCLELVAARVPGTGPLMPLVGMVGTEAEHAYVYAALEVEALRADAVKALAAIATRTALEMSIQAMRVPETARLAAESFAAIAGLDLEALKLTLPEPEGPAEPVAFEEEDLDADLVPSPDDYLPLPNVEAIWQWWLAHHERFPPDTRFVAGQPRTLDALQTMLVAGPMRRRHHAALELAIRTHGRYDVETRTFTSWQALQMAGYAAVMAPPPRPPAAPSPFVNF